MSPFAFSINAGALRVQNAGPTFLTASTYSLQGGDVYANLGGGT